MKLLFGLPSLFSVIFTLFISFEFLFNYLPQLSEKVNESRGLDLAFSTPQCSPSCWLSCTVPSPQ
jgi:hypothetical protein